MCVNIDFKSAHTNIHNQLNFQNASCDVNLHLTLAMLHSYPRPIFPGKLYFMLLLVPVNCISVTFTKLLVCACVCVHASMCAIWRGEMNNSPFPHKGVFPWLTDDSEDPRAYSPDIILDMLPVKADLVFSIKKNTLLRCFTYDLISEAELPVTLKE